jgi:hypothetical protein
MTDDPNAGIVRRGRAARPSGAVQTVRSCCGTGAWNAPLQDLKNEATDFIENKGSHLWKTQNEPTEQRGSVVMETFCDAARGGRIFRRAAERAPTFSRRLC